MKMSENLQNIVLLYSGGLDTSVILKWLVEQGHRVTCFVANIGQQDLLDQVELEKKAYSLGAFNVVIVDLRERFVLDHIFPCMYFHAVYGGGYHMCCSMARPLITEGAIESMSDMDDITLSHGATGKGNDQVRFEHAAMALRPGIKIYSPWKDEVFRKQFPGRQEMLDYALKHNIPVAASKEAPYSNDGNMAGETFEAGALEELWINLPEGMFKLTVNPWDAPDIPCDIVIQFENGIPVAINGSAKSPIEIIELLNRIGGLNGVGRYSMVEDRRVGMKSRGEYEEPALHILWKAHHALEALVLDKDFIRMKEELSPKFAQMVYDGKWFCPTMQTMQMIGLQHQQYVSGKIRLRLYKGNITITGWDSPYSLYSTEINSMDIDDPTRYNQTDAIGYIRISALSILVQANQGRNLRHK